MSELLNFIAKPLTFFTDNNDNSVIIVPQPENNDESSTSSSSSVATPSLPITSSSTTFTPTFEWQDVPEGEHLAYSGLEINLTARKARIPPKGLQLTFLIPSYENRSVRVSVNRLDTIYNVCHCIYNEWPGLRGRGFVAPPLSSIVLRYNETNTYLQYTDTVESTNLYFVQRNVSVILFNRDDNTEIQNWLSYADNMNDDNHHDQQNEQSNGNNNCTPIKQSYDLVVVDENTPLHIQFPPPTPSSTTTSYEPVSINNYDNTPIKQNIEKSTPFLAPLSSSSSTTATTTYEPLSINSDDKLDTISENATNHSSPNPSNINNSNINTNNDNIDKRKCSNTNNNDNDINDNNNNNNNNNNRIQTKTFLQKLLSCWK